MSNVKSQSLHNYYVIKDHLNRVIYDKTYRTI